DSLIQLKKARRLKSGWTRAHASLVGNKPACSAIALPKKAGDFAMIFSTWKSKAPITLKPPGARASVPRFGFCFLRNPEGHRSRSTASIFQPAALAADWAAKVLEAAPAAAKGARALGLAYLALAF